MPVPEYAHDYKALMQDMAPAFEGCKEYTLVDSEVEIVYLSLIRLQALEEAAMKRDWETVALYTPAPDDHGHSDKDEGRRTLDPANTNNNL